MDKSISWVERQNQGSAFIDLGYRDYIAARVLLKNQLIVQGLTLASTAIEKYLKAVLVFKLKKKEYYNFHFDRIQELKSLLGRHHFDVTEKFDPVFFFRYLRRPIR